MLISLLLLFGTLLPATARAGVFATILASFGGQSDEQPATTSNVQTMKLLRPAMNIDPTPDRGGGEITIVDDSALLPAEGPSGTIADIEKPKNSTISTYTVREGDTLSGIAQMLDISPNTILWANDLPSASKLRVGQTLVILPVTGLKYTVKKGDTLASIAKRTDGDAAEIASYNGLDDGSLAVGTEIIVPNGEIAASVPAKAGRGSGAKTVTRSLAEIGYYMAPLAKYTKTQGIHGYNGVDLAAPAGTPIYASAGGTVIVARSSGWNGGYGDYVVVKHANGSQTLYAHQSKIAVSSGEDVSKGQVIGYVGSTGRSTGPHLHFEIRNGGRNPF